MTMTLNDAYSEHVAILVRLAEDGDEVAGRSLACLALLAEGWRYGDPDPSDGPDDDGGGEPCVVIELAAWRMARAAA